MKILFAAFEINHHNIPFAKAISDSVGSLNFRYAVLQPQAEFRAKMGFDSDYENSQWVIRAYKDEKSYLEFVKWFYEADVVLFRVRILYKMAKERLNNNKLTFYLSERWWKPPIGRWRLLHPRFIRLAFTIRNLSKHSNFHYLAIGGYAGSDINYIAKFNDRIWNWGYFTDVNENIPVAKTMYKRNGTKINILWCGRLLYWKRVDTLIKAYALTIKDNPQCHLTIIGDGSEKRKLERLAKTLLPDSSYEFIPSQPYRIIRKFMNDSDIFVFPSTGEEGWGAVLNEAMAEGCAIIANIKSGGGKAMISDMKNGILINSDNYRELNDKLSTLINNSELMLELKFQGKETINNLWSPKIACERFLNICHALLSNASLPIYESGPMKCINES